MLPVFGLVFLALVCSSNGEDGNLPSYIHPCDFDSPKFTECVKEAIETTLPYFTKGIKEMGVPSLDPVRLEDIHIDGNGLQLNFTQAAMNGLSNSVLTRLKMDFGKDDEKFFLSFKSNMSLSAKYVVDGRILILPIKGKGNADILCQNVEVQIDSSLAHVKDSKKQTHFKLIAPSYKYNIQKTSFNFENLFDGNKQLADAVHTFANQNWKQLMDDLAPPVIKQIVRTCVKAINKFFSNVTIKQMVKNYKEN